MRSYIALLAQVSTCMSFHVIHACAFVFGWLLECLHFTRLSFSSLSLSSIFSWCLPWCLTRIPWKIPYVIHVSGTWSAWILYVTPDTEEVVLVEGETSRSHEVAKGLHEELHSSDRSGQHEKLSENTLVKQNKTVRVHTQWKNNLLLQRTVTLHFFNADNEFNRCVQGMCVTIRHKDYEDCDTTRTLTFWSHFWISCGASWCFSGSWYPTFQRPARWFSS